MNASLFVLLVGVKPLDSLGDGVVEAVSPLRVCFFLTRSSAEDARLSQTNTLEPAQNPSGNDLSMEFRTPTASATALSLVSGVARFSVPKKSPSVAGDAELLFLHDEPGTLEGADHRIENFRVADGVPPSLGGRCGNLLQFVVGTQRTSGMEHELRHDSPFV
jgi:hypothetical protein